jgi:two-component system response regulator PilR (NtrC family)
VDVRLISATHRNLAEEVKRGTFRQDLYYRLNVIELRMPSLREMPDDIPRLAAAILKRQTSTGRNVRLSADAMEALRSYEFPGNVRELENVLERAIALTTGDEIQAQELQIFGRHVSEPADVSGLPLQERLDAIERKAIYEALEQTRYNRTAAAKLLGITFRALRYRMDRLGIKDELDARD